MQDRAAATVTFAHLSDVHLAPIGGFLPWHWNPKRVVGWVNWRRKRHGFHRPEVVHRLIEDLRHHHAGPIIISGDLVNIGLPLEHRRALEWLQRLGPGEHVTVVPGNHDIYCPLWRDPGTSRWSAYMASDAQGRTLGGGGALEFPFVRVVGPVAVIGLNSAVPTPPAMAFGRLGRDQIGRLAGVLERTSAAGLFRLIVVHHAPLPGQSPPWRGLQDAGDLVETVRARGAELIVHGHEHRNLLARLATKAGETPVVGVSSLSAGRPHPHEPLGRYNLIGIEPVPDGWRLRLVARGLAAPDGPVVELEQHTIAIDRAASHQFS